MLAATRGTSGQVRGGGGDVEHWGAELPLSSGGGATGDSEEIDQLILHRDHGFGGGDAFIGRRGRILGEVAHVLSNTAQAENHLTRQSGSRQRNDNLTPPLPSAQASPVSVGV